MIDVSGSALSPQRLEVHVGETVTWRTAPGASLTLELDGHAGGHDLITRPGVIRAYFRAPGEHWYTARVREDGMRRLRGYVVVKAPAGRPLDDLTCGLQSSDRICLEP